MRNRSFCAAALAALGFVASGSTGCESGNDDTNVKTPACTPAEPPPEPPPGGPRTGTFEKINHFVVIYLENHSFDNLYGEFPGAEGLANARDASGNFLFKQVDVAGTPYATLPQPVDSSAKPPGPDGRFPTTLANEPFPIQKYVQPAQKTPDLVHRWYQEPLQIDGGKMDKFAAVSDAKGLVMGYWHTSDLPMAKEATDYTLCDHFFHAAFGGSFLNHQWLIAARHPVFPKAPPAAVAQLDKGKLLADGFVTPDGCYVVNTAFTVNTPHPADAKPESLVPNQTHATIGDRLSDRTLSWAWYSGGWNDVVSGNTKAAEAAQFQYHHQPFAYFEKYADGTAAREEHLKDEHDFLAAAKAGNLPAVSFVKPVGVDNEHPGYAALAQGETHVLELIDAVRNGPNWPDTAIIVTYDENGGQWDHVAPPQIDGNGPGTRVPAIVISPFAKRHFVDKTVYDTTSILATIEHRWGLPPLSTRDANATDLANAFDFKAR